MRTTLLFRGARAESAGTSLDLTGFEDIIDVAAKDAFRFGDVRGTDVVEVDLDDDDIVEVSLQGGVQLWLAGATLRALYESTGEKQARDGVLAASPVLPLGTPARGFGRWAMSTLRRLVVKNAGANFAELGALKVAERLEDQLLRTPGGESGAGLYACSSPAELGARITDTIPDDAAALVFLHGTGSRYDGSFGKLPEPVWNQLRNRYGDRIFALQHRTVTDSPIANALELLEHIPANARLHIISHSRGGLIGELLCRAARTDGTPFDDLELSRFRRAAARTSGDARAAYQRQAEDLEKLSELLREKRPNIERFVRVACPANGTTLASRRLDLYFSIVLNGLRLVLPGHPVVGFTGALLSSLIKTRANPAALPGLEAMMPESPLIAVLNRRDVEVTADLTVIAGDMEGQGALGALKEVVTDLFYRENHDLVVHTRAMVGGTRRKDDRARLAFRKGDGIDHFRYFETPDVASKLFLALTRADDSDAGFEPITARTAEELRRREALRAARSAAATRGTARKRPVVFLLPGIMGSHLRSADGRVWVHLLNLARGRFESLALTGDSTVEPDGIVDRSYLRLSQFLDASHRVIEFPYDWRRTIPESADRLAREAERALDETDQPIRFLAHSMGGLVARAMIARHRDLWKRITAKGGSRLVMLGTPNRGSWAVPRVLLGHDRLVKILSIIDLRQDQRELIETIAAFNGLIEMLPDDPRHDLFQDSGWTGLAIDRDRPAAVPNRDVLEAARTVRQLLSGPEAVDPAHMIYVAGIAPATPVGFHALGSRIEFLATSQGDGTVPWSLGLLERVPTYYMKAKHGDMANVPRFFPALVELLENGTTADLLQEAPAALRGRPELFPLPEDEVVAYPEQDDLEAIIVQSDAVPVARQTDNEPLAVSVAHGNLAFTHRPVMVGHYSGDTIAGAEAELDRQFEGWLSDRRQLDLYPGPIDTSGIFLRGEDARPSGAIVVGLGDVGTLTPSLLERSVTRAVLAYAAKLVDRALDRGDAEGPIETGLTSLLIGSGRGGMPIQDSLRAITSAVIAARERLNATQRHARVNIADLTFVELYEDIALQAATYLKELRGESRFQAHLSVSTEVKALPGRQRRPRFEDTRWWNRIQILENAETGSLEFRNLTQKRARSEEYLQATQKQLIDGFVRDAITTPNPDPATAGTLFELLVPNTIKEYAPDQHDLVLILDEASARYPWELMQDRRAGSGPPISVRAGLIRNLTVDTFRERPQAVIGNQVLVVGDPPSDLPPLPGAREEAQAVADLLGRGGMSVTSLIQPAAQTVITQLFARDYKIMHFAAHGLHDHEIVVREATSADDKPLRKRVSGMVIGRDYVLLTPAEARQMRAVPELVFINCCHLGRTDVDSSVELSRDPLRIEAEQQRKRHGLAANLAAEFIRMGVRAVVAAGWAVDDAAAVTFATAFYGQMLAGRPFGDAVRHARREVYEQHPAVNTWGAYQCYGDPGYTLRGAQDGYDETYEEEDFATRDELVLTLENIAQAAETIVHGDAAAEQERVEEIHKWVEKNRSAWLGDARVQAALARAYRELDQFDKAIACYRQANGASKARIEIVDLEQLANLESRIASINYLRSDRDKPARDNARKAIVDSIMRLDGLPPGPVSGYEPGDERFSPERLSLYASAQKRLCLVTEGKEWLEALRQMKKFYGYADQRAGRSSDYPALNWLFACALLHIIGEPDETPNWAEEVGRIRAAATRADATQADFWLLAAHAESEVALQLVSGTLQDAIHQIVEGYRAAWRRGGTPRKMRSALEQLDWLIDGLTRAPVRERSKAKTGARRTTANAENRQRFDRAQLADGLREIRRQVEMLFNGAS